MREIKTVHDLEALYDTAVPGALTKVSSQLTPLYHRWIKESRFLVLATVGPDGTDASPRGDNSAVVRVTDPKTLWLPDWKGNNRLDSLRNIVRDGRVSLMFMVPGCKNVVRVNGTAKLTAEVNATEYFEKNGKFPTTVLVITVGEVYFQCAKALMRSKFWESGDESDRVPTAGQFLKEAKGDFDAGAYDANYAEYARNKMW